MPSMFYRPALPGRYSRPSYRPRSPMRRPPMRTRPLNPIEFGTSRRHVFIGSRLLGRVLGVVGLVLTPSDLGIGTAPEGGLPPIIGAPADIMPRPRPRPQRRNPRGGRPIEWPDGAFESVRPGRWSRVPLGVSGGVRLDRGFLSVESVRHDPVLSRVLHESPEAPPFVSVPRPHKRVRVPVPVVDAHERWLESDRRVEWLRMRAHERWLERQAQWERLAEWRTRRAEWLRRRAREAVEPEVVVPATPVRPVPARPPVVVPAAPRPRPAVRPPRPAPVVIPEVPDLPIELPEVPVEVPVAEVPVVWPEVVIEGRLHAGEPQVRVRRRYAPDALPKRGRDEKPRSRRAHWALHYAVTGLWGAFTEATDLWEMIKNNLYTELGSSVGAMHGEDELAVFEAWVEGELELDVAGFLEDYAINYVSEAAFGVLADAGRRGSLRARGDSLSVQKRLNQLRRTTMQIGGL